MTNNPVLQNGDIWSAPIANASINPYVSTVEGDTAPGSIPPLVDDQLSGAAGQIKSNFYGWFNRLFLTPVPGQLALAYAPYSVLDASGTLRNIAAGQLSVAASSGGFVNLQANGQLAVSPLPNANVVGSYLAGPASITTYTDLREQRVERVQSTTVPWLPGDLRYSASPQEVSGWLLCDGREFAVTEYPELFLAIGYRYGGSSATQRFRIPDAQERFPRSNPATAGPATGGAPSISLQPNQLPAHTHPVLDTGHTHGFNPVPHTHGIIDPGHSHVVNDPGHLHTAQYRRCVIHELLQNTAGAELSSGFGAIGTIFTSDRATTGISLNSSFSGVQVQPASQGGQVALAGAGISVGVVGNGAPIQISPPWFTAFLFIKV